MVARNEQNTTNAMGIVLVQNTSRMSVQAEHRGTLQTCTRGIPTGREQALELFIDDGNDLRTSKTAAHSTKENKSIEKT